MCYAMPQGQVSGGQGQGTNSKFDPRTAAMMAAKSTFLDARSQWMSTKPADDSSGSAWKAWQAAQPLAGTYMKPAAIASRPVRNAQGGGSTR